MSDDIKALTPRPHKHYYTNVVMVKNNFEPAENGQLLGNGGTYYVMNEYAYMGCNCGAVVKSRVINKDLE